MKKVSLFMLFMLVQGGLLMAQCPSDCSIGTGNSLLGNLAGDNLSTGDFNTFLGSAAGRFNTSGNNNTFVGRDAGLANTVGGNNTFLGRSSGGGNTTGLRNTFLGMAAGVGNTTGDENTFIGNQAGLNYTTGNFNTFIGSEAGFGGFNESGSHNTMMGYRAGFNNASSFNVFIGSGAGENNTTGSVNTFVGRDAGNKHTTGNSNTFMGYLSGFNTTTAESNTFVGRSSGFTNTTGSANAFFGRDAGRLNTTGSENTFLGNLAGDLNTTGNLNTFVGHQAGTRNKVGIANTFIGHGTGEANESGRLNTFVGSMAGKSNTFGSQNTFIGYLAGTNNQSGAGNVFLGYQAGGNETGSSKLYIDNTATNDPLIYGDFSDNTATIHGSLGIGIKNPERPIHLRDARAIFRIDRDRADPGFAVVRYDQGFQNVWKSFYFYTLGTGVDQGKFIIADWGTDVSGPDHIARLVVANNGNVGIGNFLNSNPAEKLTVSGNAQANSFLVSSDKRYKKNIRGISGALESLDQIQGVTYAFNQEAFEEKDLPEGRSLGLIAQEVQKVYPELVREDAEGYLSVNYDGLIPVLIEALKAQKEYFEARISKLEARDQQEETADEVAPNRLAQLYQNTPNPFDQDTKISFFLPESTQKAQLFIYDLQGKQIKKVTIQDRGEASVDFQARALEAGMYFYSLMADGEEVAMKRMMITE